MSPLLSQVSVLAAKIETTPGTAISVAAADATFNVYNARMIPQFDHTARNRQGSLGNLQSIPNARRGTVTFETDLIGGTTDPAWATTFLPACGWVVSAGVWSPASEAPGSNVKTLTIALYENGRKKQLRGCVGNWELVLNAGQPARIAFTFEGIWDAPTDATILAPTYVTILPVSFLSSGLQLNSDYTPRVGTLTIRSGGTIAQRPDSTDASGLGYFMIGARQMTGSIDPEGQLVATKDFFGERLASTTQALDLTLGSGTNEVILAAPALQITNLDQADRDGILVDPIEFELIPNSGNDELTFTFD